MAQRYRHLPVCTRTWSGVDKGHSLFCWIEQVRPSRASLRYYNGGRDASHRKNLSLMPNSLYNGDSL